MALGYFRTRAFADQRQEGLALKGFETEILPHTKDVDQYWLDVALTGEPDLFDQLESITASLVSPAAFKPMACYPELANR